MKPGQEEARQVVVGGGMAGMTAALLLAGQGRAVTLIEPEPQLGGLLRSKYREGGGWFDFGTHVLSETGHAELDAMLFAGCQGDDWIRHEVISCSTFSHGTTSPSVFLDARSLPLAAYEKGLGDLLQAPPAQGPFGTLAERLSATFGATFAEQLFRPILQKFTGHALEELSDQSHLLFGLKRLLCGTPDEAKAWKQASAWNDDRLAFHHTAEGAPKKLHYYSAHKGVGLWAEQLTEQLRNAGVEVRTQTGVKRLQSEAGNVTHVELTSGESIACGRLIWSAPSFFLLRAASLPMPSSGPPAVCKMLLVDLLLDAPLFLEDFYLTCYDPDFRLFRVTNYTALQRTPMNAPAHRVTVEVILPPGVALDPATVTPEALLDEMQRMGILAPGTKLIQAWVDDLKHGFPVQTPAVAAANEAMASTAMEHFSNLVLLGRTAGRAFFMGEVLLDTHRLLA